MPNSPSQLEGRQTLLVDVGLLVLLVLFIGIVTAAYISREHNFHWWIDWYARTLDVATTFQESPGDAIELVRFSLIGERNRLFTLPLLPFIWVFGESRLVYELGLALVYLLPFVLAMGAIATQLIRKHSRTVFWATAFLTLLIPVTWIPTFMGIPDTGGAAFIGWATFLYLQDVRLKPWWRIPLIGFFIAAAILLRRPFVYAGVAFLAAISLHALVLFIAEVRKPPSRRGKRKQNAMALTFGRLSSRVHITKPIAYRVASLAKRTQVIIPWTRRTKPTALAGLYTACRNLFVRGVQIALIGAAALTTLAIVAPQFTHAALTKDYKTLYTSWTLPFSDIFNLYASFYGWGTWLLVVLGFSVCIMRRSLVLSAVSVMGFSGVLSLLIWLVLLRYGNVFYSLQVTPFVVIGLVALIWTTWSRLKGKMRSLILGGIGCYLVANLIVGLTPMGSMSRVFHPVFALNMPPLERTDYDEVVRLVDTLRQLTPKGEPVFVVGYQRLQLTSGLVRAAEYLLYPEERLLNILVAPEVDSRDSYPLEQLLEAQYVVIPSRLPDYSSDPTQLPAVGEWLPNKEYDVVNVVFDAFTQNWEFTRDFKRLPVQFNFENGVTVSIYQRTRPTSVRTAVQTLEVMQKHIDQRPGSQRNWIVLSQWVGNTRVQAKSYNTYEVVAFRREPPWAEEQQDVYRISESTLLAKELGLPTPSTREVIASPSDLASDRKQPLSGKSVSAPRSLESSAPSPSLLPHVNLVRALRNQGLERSNRTIRGKSSQDSVPLVFDNSYTEQGNFTVGVPPLSLAVATSDREQHLIGASLPDLPQDSSEDRTQQLGTSLLYLGPVPNRAKISGAITYIDRACVGSFIRVAMLNSDGQIVSSTESAYPHNSKKVTAFELSLPGQNSAYLLFNMLSYNRDDLVNSCTLQIKPLKVLSQK